ncbi:DUF6630 family protein [Dyella telluris]|uniref:DUF6630 domain-containing protein n=1 Tax=Dyella telluris TaxID=2763498 RepID=A0A7G8Q7P0_9GAMM|nr:hypothetical protein [Dyella telluris]QNK02798.1 hypothetical protein H8F01_06650 [Dyella telluris]
MITTVTWPMLCRDAFGLIWQIAIDQESFLTLSQAERDTRQHYRVCGVKMLGFLKKWFASAGKELTLSSSDVALELDETIDALLDLFKLLAKPMGVGVAEAVAAKVRREAARGEGGTIAFIDVAAPGDEEETFGLAIHVDWKAWGEIEWQANRALRALGSPEPWSRMGGHCDVTAAGVFVELAEWLEPRGLQLVFLDTGGDEYLAFLVSQADADAAFALAADAELSPMTLEQFRIREIS